MEWFIEKLKMKKTHVRILLAGKQCQQRRRPAALHWPPPQTWSTLSIRSSSACEASCLRESLARHASSPYQASKSRALSSIPRLVSSPIYPSISPAPKSPLLLPDHFRSSDPQLWGSHIARTQISTCQQKKETKC